MMSSRPPPAPEERVPMIRMIATVAAGATLWAALAGVNPAAQAAPQSASQPAQQYAPASTPSVEAVAALQAPPAAASRKPHGGSGHAGVPSTVMRGGDISRLVAMLPWWRPYESRRLGPDPGELESPILTACDLWLGFPYATADAQSLTVRLAAAQKSEIALVANHVRVMDAGELNEIDLTAPDEPLSAGGPWLAALSGLGGLGGLLAGLAGTMAAVSAVRYFVA
jgi:hypothetical protein